MVYQRIFQSVTMLFLAGTTFAACGSDEPQTPQTKYCTAKCNCNKCTPNESATCLDDITNLSTEAGGANCKDAYDAYLTCLNADGVCSDGDFDESACFNEETDLKTCINPPPACATVNNGICNEPAPAGDGTCATGTDTKDCMMVAMCPTAGDGICDEPQAGGSCPAGSDPIDCPCTKCATYAGNGQMGTLCAASNSLFMNLYECACGSSCINSCGDIGDICDGGSLSGTCYTCLTASCNAQYMACSMDI